MEGVVDFETASALPPECRLAMPCAGCDDVPIEAVP